MPGKFFNISLEEYLADRGRWNGSTLRMIDTNPEAVEKWLRGEDIDNPTRAKGRGSVVHCKLLEGDDAFRDGFARFPNKNEGLTEEKLVPEGKVTAKKTGRHIPQDASPAGARTGMVARSAFEKTFKRDWLAANAGKTVWYPEDEPAVAAMVRAAHEHPEAAALLDRTGFAGEVTAHWDCPASGQPLRSRFDGVRLREKKWIELKTIDPGRHGRLDTLDPQAVRGWVRDQGFAIKSAMCHDAFEACAGEKGTGYWIIIEATEDRPRVSVVEDVYDSDLATLGRVGCEDWGIKGYQELARQAGTMLAEGDFTHDCVRGIVPRFTLPQALVTSMQFDRGAKGEPDEMPNLPVIGATPLGDYDG